MKLPTMSVKKKLAKELWNNMGLCCFYAGQYDLTLSCFERALMLADDNNMADVWYNIGQAWNGFAISSSQKRGLINLQ